MEKEALRASKLEEKVTGLPTAVGVARCQLCLHGCMHHHYTKCLACCEGAHQTWFVVWRDGVSEMQENNYLSLGVFFKRDHAAYRCKL